MRYSIRGEIDTIDFGAISRVLANHPLQRLTAHAQNGLYEFEAWVVGVEARDALYDELKPHIDSYHGWIDWHQCSHGTHSSTPCTIEDTYRVGD